MAVYIKDCIKNMNLVIGCTIGCSYCYARNNVRRFHMIDDFEKPEFFPNKLPGPCAWHPCIYEGRSASYHGRDTDDTRISPGFLPGIGGTEDMAEVKESSILIQNVETKNIMTKSALPVGGYSVNPYVGCTHGCKYCYASFMKRFTGHTEPWGTFLDVKHWPAIKNQQKYKE